MSVRLDESAPVLAVATPAHASTKVATPLRASGHDAGPGIAAPPRWTFGDGHTGHGWLTDHRWQRPGTYTVTVSVSDRQGYRTTRTLSVLVR